MESPTYKSFAEHFGEDQADAILLAAEMHANGVNSKDRGSDVFRWAIIICIGYQCFEKEKYRKQHNITAPEEEIKDWIVLHGDIGNHEGDIDYLAAFVGRYTEYVLPKKEVTE